MRTIANVFGRSPFIPLQHHMDKVAACVSRVPDALDAYKRRDLDAVVTISEDISKLEHEADEVKHGIRNNLPRGLFMAVNRSSLLEILAIQDSIANRTENLGVVLTFKFAKTFEGFDALFDPFVAKNLETFLKARKVIGELDELLESGFGGTEAARVREMAHGVAQHEYEADVLQRDLVRALFAHEEEMSYGDFFLWTRIFRQIQQISDRSDRLTAAIRRTLDTS